MTDQKTTELTALTALADADLLMAIDVSDTTMDASGTNKKITKVNAFAGLQPLATVLTNTQQSFTSVLKTKLDGIAASATANNGALADLDTVDTAQIDANAITTAKILDANVTAAKLASNVKGDVLSKNISHSVSGAMVFPSGDSTVVLNVPLNYAGTIDSLTAYNSSGSVNITIATKATLTGSATNVTSLVAVTASTSIVTTNSTGADSFTSGKFIQITLASNSTSTNLYYSINITRTA